MTNTIILKAEDLNGYLTKSDKDNIAKMHSYYDEASGSFGVLAADESDSSRMHAARNKIIALYDTMGDFMQEITAEESHIHVYSFKTPFTQHGEVSRLIAKLRDTKTGNDEFIYYIQRAYELLFNLAWANVGSKMKNHLVVKTPVDKPVRNYAVHKIPDVDDLIEDTVMCVMLRGALLPSMILSKEIQEYSSDGYITPFALFRIRRDDTKMKENMEYILDLDYSYFDLDALSGKNLLFADPMNATGGSLVTIINYLQSKNIQLKSVKVFNVIASLQGALQIVRSISNVDVYTLWMDPVLNDSAYILPGLGDAGDRINGRDENFRRNLIQLV
ncbi:MAG: uracil phosphoribosyltransferase, partial [Spirochaeta sp. LUC14_002_19_P3]